MSRRDGTQEEFFLGFPPSSRILGIEMDERSGFVGWGGGLERHGGSVREWRDPSPWLGGGGWQAWGNGGADKV